MAATLGDPFVLTTYPVSKRKKTGHSHGAAHLHASPVASTSSSSSALVSVAVQGDGLHILDTATLHPLSSHSLGPSVSFSCPPATRVQHESKSKRRSTTYAAIESAPGISSPEAGRLIWTWGEDLSSASAEQSGKSKPGQKDKELKLEPSENNPIRWISAPDSLPDRLVLLSQKGDLTVLSSQLDVKWSQQPGGNTEDLHFLNVFQFSRQTCTFVPSNKTSSAGSVILAVLKNERRLLLRSFAVSEDDVVECLNDVTLEVGNTTHCSCNETGYFTILTQDGAWHAFQLELSEGNELSSRLISQPFMLYRLQFGTESLSLLPLSSSRVLLAGITTSEPEVALLLWDLQYSVVLASHIFAPPSSLFGSSKPSSSSVSVRLSAVSESQVALTLSPASSVAITSSHRSTIYAVPFTLPAVSTVAAALGKAAATAKWLSVSSGPTKSTAMDNDQKQLLLLEKLRNYCSQGQLNDMKLAYYAFVEQNRTTESHISPISEQFVTELVSILAKHSSSPQGTDVMYHLISNGFVRRTMLQDEDGALWIWKSPKNWKLVCVALHHIVDMAEDDAMNALHELISIWSTKGPQSKDKEVPTLEKFLFQCVNMDATPSQLRIAIHRNLACTPSDLVAVLRILERWLKIITNESSSLTAPEYPNGRGKENFIPPLSKILAFLQTFIDASLVALLQHTPAHARLTSILAILKPQLELIDDAQALRGPLEPFVKAHERNLRKKQNPDEKKKENKNYKKKEARERFETAIGLYRFEELRL